MLIVPIMSLIAKEDPVSCTAFVVVTLVSVNLEQLFSLSLTFMILAILKIADHVLLECPSVWMCWLFPCD